MAIATDALSSQFGIAIISAPNALPLLGERKAVLFLLKRAFEPLSTTIDGSFRADSPINRAKSFLASFTLRLISSSLLFINLKFMCDFLFLLSFVRKVYLWSRIQVQCTDFYLHSRLLFFSYFFNPVSAIS